MVKPNKEELFLHPKLHYNNEEEEDENNTSEELKED